MAIKQRFILYITAFVLLAVVPMIQMEAKDISFYASDSKLASGNWIKLRIAENAIYKLTYEDIQSMGLNPAMASIHGYGGWMLNENFAVDDYADDLPEVPVWISGSDNKLDPGEFILFYGKGTVKWTYNYSDKEFQHEKNVYSDHGYYFITDGIERTKTIEKGSSALPAQFIGIRTFDDYALHEQDIEFIVPSGRELFGESFSSNTTQTFHFNIDGMVTETATARLNFVSAASISNTSVKAAINSSSTTGLFPYNVQEKNDAQGYIFNNLWNWTPDGSNRVNVAVTYSHRGYKAFLNYLRLNMKRQLKPYGGYTFFRNKPLPQETNPYIYEIEEASANMFVLELSPGKEIQQKNTVFNNNILSFYPETQPSSVTTCEYVLIDPSKSFPKPENAGAVSSQNLHSLSQTDMVIITQPAYLRQSELLAQKHKEQSGLSVNIVMADQIYNEFSSGNPDATAYRRLMKMFYDRGINNNTAPKYLLLMGDGAHDNRMLTTKWKYASRSNYLLTYQSRESLSREQRSYSADDYFGYMNNDNGISKAELHISVGRLPVKSTREADNAVGKIVDYMENKNSGLWKNKMIFIGGDESSNSDQYLHIRDADRIAQRAVTNHPELLASKIYYNSFNRVVYNGINTYPGASEKLNVKLNEGAMLLNYLGHGSIKEIDKFVITESYINQAKYKHIPIWIMGTCSFGRYDDLANSGCEAAILNPNSGAIATIAGSRIVLIGYNVGLNQELMNYLYSKDEKGNWLRIGDVVRKAKNARSSDTVNKLSHALLGDPALMLNFPNSTVRVESVNGKSASDPDIQFKAEGMVELKGTILGPNGEIETDFNGEIHAQLVDCINQLKTNDHRSGGADIFSYTEYLNTLYQGKSSVVEGNFTIRIPIPREISFKNEPGKISFYAISKTTKSEAKGYYDNFIIGGSADRDPNQEIGAPVIKQIYLNTPDFVDGGTVNETPYFVAEVYDSLGINRSGVGIGHDITLSIDNLPLYTYSLNSYYIDSDEAGHGVVSFAIPDSLPSGNHTLTFKVWNILNKSTTQTMQFFVEPGKAPKIYDLTVSSNPAKTSVDFYLRYDRPEVLMDVTLSVLDLTGCPVWTTETAITAGESVNTKITTWDLHSNGGGRVKPGIYLYRVSLSSKYGKEATESKKLIILAQ